MPSAFEPIARPQPVVLDTTLDQELGKAADDAKITLYFINMAVISASDLINADMFFDKSDPYCEVVVGDLIQKTPTINNDLNPVWNEQMSFFVPEEPKKILFRLYDEEATSAEGRDDFLGEVEFELGDMFETQMTFEGDLKLQKVKKGSVRIKVKCRVLMPIETEVKLGYVERQLEGKQFEQEATVAALDESEKLREEAINELSMKEQEVIEKAEEIAEKHKLHQEELTEKEKKIMDQAEAIENKIQEYEEAQVALQETELKKKEVETKLTEAEEEIMRKADELEVKERENAEALTAKEKEILAAADKLEAKERAYEETQKELDQLAALKVEVENELTAKERTIQQQAEHLKLKEAENAEALSEKEKEILEKSKALEEREAAAKEAQRKQDEKQAELDTMKKAAEDAERWKVQKNAEIDTLYKKNRSLDKELKEAKLSLMAMEEKLEEETAKGKQICGQACTVM